MVGIQKSKEVFTDIADLAIEAIGIVKGGKIAGVFKIFKVLEVVKELIVDAPQALPELLDLDPKEAGELTTCCYEAVKRIVLAIKV